MKDCVKDNKHLSEYKFCPSDVKLLYHLKIKLNPIQNFIMSLVSISNRKHKRLGSSEVLLQLSQFCPDYFNEKYGLLFNTTQSGRASMSSIIVE